MKLKHLSFIAVAAMLAACSNSDKFTIEGTVDNAAGKKIYLESPMGLKSVIDSAVIAQDGSFRFKGAPVSRPAFYNLRVDEAKQIMLLLDSTETIKVNADLAANNWYESIKIEGSAQSMELQAISMRAVILRQAVEKTINATGEEQEKAGKNLSELIQGYKNYVRTYIFEHPQSFVGYYALYINVADYSVFDVMADEDHILFSALATSLNVAYPDNEDVKALCNYVLSARRRRKLLHDSQHLLENAVEVKSPDLSMPTLDGETVKLSDLRGKYVILHYWLSTDRNSREANRQLAKLYEKYHSKGLEIYSVCLDRSKILWEDATLKDNITWVNTCDLRGQYSPAVSTYNVSTYPANFILAKDGELIGKDLFGTRLDAKIKDLIH
ncbi:MAG: AhpC/TSA family protein [Bacteroidales bacterium]|nr:AhpC/TSA family protein [Bacteroidales bacterium]